MAKQRVPMDPDTPGSPDQGWFNGPLARSSDPDTSHDAADAVLPHLTKIQRQVIDAYKTFGPMTAKECETLRPFEALGFSTVRKRCSELVQAGALEDTGERRGRCAVLRIKP